MFGSVSTQNHALVPRTKRFTAAAGLFLYEDEYTEAMWGVTTFAVLNGVVPSTVALRATRDLKPTTAFIHCLSDSSCYQYQ